MVVVLASLLLGIWQFRSTHPVRRESNVPALQILKNVAVAETEFQAHPMPANGHAVDAISLAPEAKHGREPEYRCWRAGPLDEGAAGAAMKQFAAPEFKARVIREVQRKKVADWVYLPPMATPTAAREEQRRLADLGVEDLAVVVNGPRRNAISLGLFVESGGALRRVAELQAKGVKARVEPRFQNMERIFIVVQSRNMPGSNMTWRLAACE